MASAAATTARPHPMNRGERPPTATRVSGTVKENAATPRSPHQRPALDAGGTTGRVARVALLSSIMNDDSSSRIVTALRDWIRTAPPGSRLPSTRDLVAAHRASPVTVQRALRTLAGEGLIESRSGVGTFVRAVRTLRPADYGWQTA